MAADQLVLSLLLNTLWISVLYQAPYGPLLGTRVLQCAAMAPVQLITLGMLGPLLAGARRPPAG